MGFDSGQKDHCPPQGKCPELNVPITSDETAAAFKRLKRHKASGLDGIKAEYLLDAEEILLEPLTTAFNQMLTCGVPESWCSGVIHPIFKSGDVNDANNYRGITVTSVLAKLFAMVLETRMSQWTEDRALRADGQAGFRKDHRTTDHVFIMRTLIQNAKKSRKKLYCCFVDFKKAFDSVPRTRLWEVLSDIGISGEILSCLQSIYAQDEAVVLTPAGLTNSFRCTTGVKQGCPASPLLFGLFIDEIEAMLRAAKEDIDAPELLGTLVAILLFADDIELMSHSPQGLQNQLSILQQFCTDRGLTVNVKKTKVIVFESKVSACPDFTFNEQVVERVTMFKYLGITFHATRGLACAMEHLCNSARKALFALYGRCHEMQVSCPSLKCLLFDALVRPILSYASEIWVCLDGGKVAMQNLERVQTQFLRQLLGVPVSTSTKFILAEFGKLPLKHSWLQQSLKYLSRLQKLDETRLCKVAFLADVQKGLGWFQGLRDELRTHHNIHIPRTPADFDLTGSSHALKDSFVLQGMTADTGNHIQQTYFSLKTEFRLEPYITQSKSMHVRSSLARFRVGAHWLQVCMGRHRRVEYESRRCPICTHCVEDEMHAIFDCRSYAHERLIHADLFESADSLRSFLASNPPHSVAKFLDDCRNVRAVGPIDVDCCDSCDVELDDYASS